MIDETYNCERYIAQYDRNSDELINEIRLNAFDLTRFQKQFRVSDPTNPMFDCCPIKQKDFDFLKKFIAENVHLNFNEYVFGNIYN